MSEFAIFIALPEELGAAIEVLKANGDFQGAVSDIEAGRSTFRYELTNGPGTGKTGDVFLIRGMGNTKSAAFVGASIVAGSPPQYALLIGISGSLAPETVKLGDVVISAHVKYYAPDKIKDIPHDNWKIISPEESSKICNPDHPQQVSHYRDGYSTLLDGRDKRFESSYYRYIRHSIVRDSEEYSIDKFMSMRKKIHGESCANGFSLFSGAVLGSNLVLDSKYYVDYLIEKNRCSDMDFYMLNSPEEFKERCKWDSSELLAVDMESYGFFTAFEDMKRISQGTHAIAVRGISDLASGKEDLDRETKGKHRHNATKRAVQVGIDYLQEQFQPSRFRLP